jgi:hypothetical protein
MRTTLRALATVITAAAVCALPACSGSAPETPPPAPAPTGGSGGGPAPGAPRTGDAGAVETVFHDYYRALLARDFAGACGFNAPETTEQLLTNLRDRGVTAATCEEGFRQLYAVPGAADAADAVANSAAVQDVRVTGDDATITWTADINGGRPTITSALRRIEGSWLLVDPGR